MNKDYGDKEFREIYSGLVENVKKLTTKWDPEFSDESDPGVVILKSFALYLDKINYKINYRNSQNSVSEVTDLDEAKRLFSDLGYQLVEKKSATGDLLVKCIHKDGDSRIDIPIFSQFSDIRGNQNYTSTRSSCLDVGLDNTYLIHVQEGIPNRYRYENREIFSEKDLTVNLRLYLKNMGEISSNGVIICSNKNLDENGLPKVSDWLNIGGSLFTSVETANIFSLNKDPNGESYIQFYDKSLPNLSNGIQIWVISSSGAAGNVAKNTICKWVSSPAGDLVTPENFRITHEEFSSGSDAESLEIAKENYYNSFGVNNTLVSERDYTEAISKIVKPDLTKLCSKVLVSGIDGYHNIAEIVSLVNNGNNRSLLIKVIGGVISTVYVNLLKNSNNYYESFEKLVDDETQNLLIKALYKNSVVSNKLKLVKTPDSANLEPEDIYKEFIFDLASLKGTLIINSDEDVETIKNKVILAIYKSFKSSNLQTGKLLEEKEISKVVESELDGVIMSSFYYDTDGHQIFKKLNCDKLTADQVINGKTKEIQISGVELTDDEKINILAKSVLRGNLNLFSKEELQVPPGSVGQGESISESEITKIKGTVSIPGDNSNGYSKTLVEDEFVQFYSKTKVEEITYGFGIGYILQAPQVRTIANLSFSIGYFNKGTIFHAGSELRLTDKNSVRNLVDYSGGTKVNGTQFSNTEIDSVDENNPVTVKLGTNYTVQEEYTLRDSMITTGSTIYDGSEIIPNGAEYEWLNGNKEDHILDNRVYSLILKNEVEYELNSLNGKLIVYPTDDIKSVETLDRVIISGFEGGLKSSGEISIAIPSKVDDYLQTSQEISNISDQVTEVSGGEGYSYILISKKENINLSSNTPYLLEENEHFIYGNKLTQDFIDFGSGTLLETTEDSIQLKTVSSITDNLSESMEPLEKKIRLFNTTIDSYSKGYSINSRSNINNNNSDWGWPSGENTMITMSKDGISRNYGEGYKYRVGRIISPSKNKVITLYNGQSLEISKEDGSTTTYTGGNFSISFSKEISTDLSGNLISGKTKLSLYPYRFNFSSDGCLTGGVSGNYLSNSISILVEAQSNLSGSTSFTLIENSSYLLEVKVNLDVDGVGRQISFSGADTDILNSNESVIGSSGNYLIYVKGTASNSSFNIEFNEGGTEKDKLEIVKFIRLKNTNPYLNDFDTEVYAKVKEIIGDGNLKFDFLYYPDSPFNPLDPMLFYDSRHILNKNILTVIDLNKLAKDGNLNIIRRR